MEITLYSTAVTDLNIKYARDMGNNKVRHYMVPYMFLLMTGADSERIVSEYIQINEPEVTKITFVKPEVKTYSDKESAKGTTNGSALQAIDMTEAVLGKNPEIRKSLERVKSKNLLLQTMEVSVLDKFLDKIQDFLLTAKLKFIHGYEQFAKRGELMDHLFVSKNEGVYFAKFNRRAKRKVTQCSFLSYCYDDSCEKEAIEALLLDLHILNQRGLIMGHLAMPSSLVLANTIGIGPLPRVLFCFLFVDKEKLAKQLNKKVEELPSNPLFLIEVKSETQEGGVGPKISKKPDPEIEEINVMEGSVDLGIKAVQDTYLNTREYVNEAAAKMRERIKNEKYEVTSTNLESIGPNSDRKTKVQVNITRKE